MVGLGAWVAGRHDKYIAMMKRIQRMIVAVLKEEKEERSRRDKVKKVTLGYDPKEWIKTSPSIKGGKARERHIYGP